MMHIYREHDKLLVQSVAVEKKTTTEWKAKNGIHDLKKKKKACCLR